MAQLSRARDRSMHSIVATIQAEQDKAIRAPGRGRRRRSPAARAPARPSWRCTARRTCSTPTGAATRRGGVLVVGPSGVFMRYIERVLPSASARPRSRCARSARSSTASARPATTSRPSPTSRARPRMAELMRRTARQQAPGSPSEFRIFWRDDMIVLDRGQLGRAPPPADVARAAATGSCRGSPAPLLDAMWRQVRGERGRERGREAFDDDMLVGRSRSSTSRSRGGRRSTRATVLGWLRDPEFLARVGRRRAQPEEQRAAGEVVGQRRRLRRSRTCRCSTSCATRSATCPARTDDERDARRHRSARGRRRHAGAVHRGRPRVRADRPGLGAADPPASRTTASPTCSSTRRRTSRRCSGGWSAGAAGRRRGRSSATRRSRRGRCPPRRPRRAGRGARGQGAATSSTSRPTTATPRRSTPTPRRTPSASASTPTCPTAVRVDRRRAARGRAASPTSRRRPARPWPSVAGQVDGTVGIVVPVARRSEVNAWLASWPELADDARRRPRRRRLVGHAVGRGPDRGAHRPRHQGPGVRRHRGGPARRRSRPSPPPAAPPCTSSHPRHPAAHRRLLIPRPTGPAAAEVGSAHVREPGPVHRSAALVPPSRRCQAARGVGDRSGGRPGAGDPRHGRPGGGAPQRGRVRRSTYRSRPGSRRRTTSPTGCWRCRSGRSASAASRPTTTARRWSWSTIELRGRVPWPRSSTRSPDVAGRVRRPRRLRHRRRGVRRARRGDHRRRDRPGRGRQPGHRPPLPRDGRRLGRRQGAHRASGGCSSASAARTGPSSSSPATAT